MYLAYKVVGRGGPIDVTCRIQDDKTAFNRNLEPTRKYVCRHTDILPSSVAAIPALFTALGSRVLP